MKKVLISLFLLISTLMLSSCQVNWFGSHFDVPWYFIAVPVFVLFIVLYVIIVSKTYVCPKCKTEFKPKWYQIYITIHFNDSRIAKCPNCGRKGFCKRKDQWHLFCQHISEKSTSALQMCFFLEAPPLHRPALCRRRRQNPVRIRRQSRLGACSQAAGRANIRQRRNSGRLCSSIAILPKVCYTKPRKAVDV